MPLTSALLPVLGAPLTVLSSGFASTTRLCEHAQPVHSLGSAFLPRPLFTNNDLFRCRNIAPACHRLRLCRPRLRTRLTLRRLTLLRNPQAFGGSGSHRPCATHSGIRSSGCSTSPCGLASLLDRTLPYHCLASLDNPRLRYDASASLRCRCQNTRPVSYYALFQGWLLLSQPPGCLGVLTSFPTQHRF